MWRNYIFNTNNKSTILKNKLSSLNKTKFDGILNEYDFKKTFFEIMHLFKEKSTLCDYLDLNKRYISITDVIIFQDEKIEFDIIPKHFFKSIIDNLYKEAYLKCDKLEKNVPLETISSYLYTKHIDIISSVNTELNLNISTIDEAKVALENNRYYRFRKLINNKFNDENILKLLEYFEIRSDDNIRNMVTDNSDIPTIFEYILGILWYKISNFEGKILDYMKLSLGLDLLPKTHASGGVADIVYEYNQNEVYPKHTLLLEATLSDSTNQRRMEMEPVSRHLGQHLLTTGNLNSYCIFITNSLNVNVISDFINRKYIPYYDSKNNQNFIDGMKIIPLEISELKTIIKIKNKKSYKQLYDIFEKAHNSSLKPHIWYNECIKSNL